MAALSCRMFFIKNQTMHLQNRNNNCYYSVVRWAGTNADVQKEIAKKYKDAKIVVDDIDYENLKQKQIRAERIAEYDLIWVAEGAAKYVANNWLLPLDDYVKKSGVDMNNYSAGITKINTINGKLYAMPDMLQGLILTYDKDWFNKEGQKLPTTVEELISVAKYFKEKGTGIAIPAKQGQAATDVFSTILYSAGGDYFDENGNLNLLSERSAVCSRYLRPVVQILHGRFCSMAS